MLKSQQRKHNLGSKDLRARIKCEQCGAENVPDRIFCSDCAAKLPLIHDPFADAPPPDRLKPILKQVPRVISLFLLIGIILAFWPPTYIGMDGVYRSETILTEKIEKLSAGIKDGREVTVVVKETGINALMAKRLEVYLADHQFDSGAVLRSVRMKITPPAFFVQVKTSHGPIIITRTVRGVPRIENGEVVFDVERVKVGLLPLPSALQSIVVNKVWRVFARMDKELNIIENLTRVELSEGSVRVTAGESAVAK